MSTFSAVEPSRGYFLSFSQITRIESRLSQSHAQATHYIKASDIFAFIRRGLRLYGPHFHLASRVSLLMSLPISLFTVDLSVCLSVCLSVWLFFCLSFCPFFSLSICLSGCLSVFPSSCLSVGQSDSLSVCLSTSSVNVNLFNDGYLALHAGLL